MLTWQRNLPMILTLLIALLAAQTQTLVAGLNHGSAILTYTASGPSAGTTGSPSADFTVTIGSGTFNGSDTITITDGGQGGTFTPSVGSPGTSSVTVTPTNAATSFTFTYTAAISIPVTLTFTNAQGWTNPATLPYTGGLTYTASGPSTGTVGVASANFTVTIGGGTFNGSQTITVVDGAQGGTITPSVGSPGTSSVVVTPVNGATSFTFTYNAASAGAKTLTFTNAQGWTNPATLPYTASARTFTATGPSTGTAGVASTNFTVTLGNGTFNGSQTITIADGSQGGTITPSVGSPGTSSVTVTPTNGATSFTFTYNAAVATLVTLTFTNAQSWTNPATLPYTGAVAYTASGPSTGTTSSPSTNFTVSMPAGVQFNGSQTVTIADASGGGTFTPSVGSPGTSSVVVTPAAAATSFTFTYNAASDGAKTLTFTNAQGWTNPSPLTYTASGGGGGCAAATTWLARTSGLNGTETAAYTAMICGMITDGIGCSQWSGSTGNMDVLYIFATNTTTTANLNLCSTSFTATTTGTAPTFTTDQGYTGNASSAVVSGYVPSGSAISYTQNSASIHAWSLTNTRANSAAIVGHATGGIASFNPWNSSIDTSSTAINNTAVNANSPGDASGYFVANRVSSANYTTSRNGAVYGPVVVSTSAAIPATSFEGLTDGTAHSTRQVAMIGEGGGLTTGQITAYYTRVCAYMLAVGAVGSC